MALKQPTASKFENVEDNETAEAEAQATTKTLSADERVAAAAAKSAAAKAAETEEKPSASRAVTAAPARNVATSIMAADPFKALDNALKVDYNTLPRIMVTNGNVQNKENKKLMGDTVGFEIISIQKHWVLSPGGETKDEESLEFVRYSDDGKVSRDGEDMADCLEAAKEAGYAKAAIKERCILVGCLFDSGKLKEMANELVQIDLAPNSKKNFEQYRITTAFKVGKGLMDPELANRVQIEAVVQSKNGNDWTEASFRSYPTGE